MMLRMDTAPPADKGLLAGMDWETGGSADWDIR